MCLISSQLISSDLFIDKNEDDIHNIHYVSNIDILIENIVIMKLDIIIILVLILVAFFYI